MASYGPLTALVVVDMQNEFADPAGSLSVRGAEGTFPVINDEVTLARQSGSLVVYTQDWHPAHTPHFEQDGGIWPVHCVQETWGAELHPALQLDGPVVRKGTGGEDGYSGFTMRDSASGGTRPTELDRILRARDVRRLVVVGLATDYCVRETALDGIRLGYEVSLVRAGVRAVDLQPGDGDRALAELRAAGVQLE
ncbi:MAG: isochorismatase family protein [Candidatus Limnocylindria bacterium]